MDFKQRVRIAAEYAKLQSALVALERSRDQLDRLNRLADTNSTEASK